LKNYIIGYGSLFKKSSLQRTLPDVRRILPIYLHSYVREWNAVEDVTTTFSTTFLGIQKAKDEKISAIIFEVEEYMLPIIDSREFLYTRDIVEHKDIEFIRDTLKIDSKDRVWIYITNRPSQPSEKNPIIQSYVDTCISGCLEIEKEFKIDDFAQEFINTTKKWSQHWVNDRIFPRAPHIHQPDAYVIDKLLNKNIEQYFSKIEIE
jgi:hypothetical protein